MDKINLLLSQQLSGAFINKKIDLALSVHGINFTEFLLMYQLGKAQDLTLSRIALAEKVALTPSGVTRILLPMEKNGLIEKKENPRDARQSLVVLSLAGQEFLNNAIGTVALTTENIFSLLSQEELVTLNTLVNKLKV